MSIQRKLLSHLLVSVVLVATTLVVTTFTASAFNGGSGTSGDPYQISSCAQLLAIDDSTANLAKAYVLTGNIDCTGETVSPMVNGTTYFTGTLDGGGFDIDGLSLSCSTIYCGLFHTVTSGTVRNIVFDSPVVASTSSYVGVVAGLVGSRSATAIFEDVVIRSMDVDAAGLVGGIAGMCIACSVTRGSVSGSVDAVGDRAGGLFGQVGEALYSHIFAVDDFLTTADISGRDYVGGIVGQAYRATYTSTTGVFQTTISPSVSVSGTNYVGGVVGHTSYDGGFNFEYIASHATVSGGTYVGGIIGWSRGTTERVYRSYSTGALSQSNPSCGSGAGGITASNDSNGFLRVIESYSTSSITGACRFGGLVGNASTNRCTITDSFFRGSLTRAAGSSDTVIGGITGRGCTSITRSYAATNALQSVGGGISNDISVVPVCADVFWDTESSGRSTTRCSATGKTSAQMQSQVTFTNFDFSSVWNIDPNVNDGYPFLRNLVAPGGDVTPPTATWTAPSTPSSSRTLSYTLIFSEAVSGIAAGDFSNTGTATGCVFSPSSSSGTSVTVSVTCSSDGTVIVRLSPNSVTDGASNTGPIAAESSTSVTINTFVATTVPVSVTTVAPTQTTVAPTQTTAPSGTVAPTQSSPTTLPSRSTSGTSPITQVSGTTIPIATTTSTPAPTTTTTTLPLVDVPDVADGGGALLVNGQRIEATITRENNQLVIAAGVLRARISAVQREGGRAPLDSQGRIRMDQGDSIEIEVTGFGSESQVEVRMYSDPVLLGRSTVSALGNLMASYEVPESVDDGRHTVVLLGESQQGEELTFALAVFVGAKSTGPSALALLVGIPLGMAVIAALVIPAILRRRRNDEVEK